MSVQDSQRTRSSSLPAPGVMMTGRVWRGLPDLQPLAAARRAARDRTGRSLVMLAGMAIGAAFGVMLLRVLWPSLGMPGSLALGMASVATCTYLAHEFWLLRVKRAAANSNPVDRELLLQVQFQDDLATIAGLGLEAEAASKLKVQVWREHRAGVLQERRRAGERCGKVASESCQTAEPGQMAVAMLGQGPDPAADAPRSATAGLGAAWRSASPSRRGRR